MGYPMTLRRFLNRNHLHKGGYDEAPPDWFRAPPVTVSADPVVVSLVNQWAEAVQQVQGQIRLMAGDLRRLEADTLDEQAINEWITRRTGIDTDTVATVLKTYWEL